MNTLFIAILSIALSVMAQFSPKAGMSGEGVKAILAKPKSIMSLVNILMDKYVLGGFVLYGLGFVFAVMIAYVLGEHVAFPRVIGVTLVCARVFLVGRS